MTNPRRSSPLGNPPPRERLSWKRRRQTLVQLTDELLDRLDAHRAREGRSRSEVVRDAIDGYLAADREAEIDRRIVEAYARQPPQDVWGEETAKRLIAAEPW